MENPHQINAGIAILPLAEVPEPVPEATLTGARLSLGDPLSIREVAKMLGCSAWTVRHGYLPQGLPHFRSGPNGKLVFFRNQVVAWILQKQKQKGGI